MRRLRLNSIGWLTLSWLLAAGSHGSEPGRLVGEVVLAKPVQPVAQAVVYLGARTAPAAKAELPPVIVDVARGRLGPRLQCARSGAALILQNSDPTLRMIRVEEIQGNGPPRVLQRIAMPYAGFERSFRLPTTGSTQLLRVVGDNQQNLSVAYLAVIPHEWAAVTGADGKFAIGNVSPGTYPVHVWHERRGSLRGQVTIRPNREVSVRFEFPAAPPD